MQYIYVAVGTQQELGKADLRISQETFALHEGQATKSAENQDSNQFPKHKPGARMDILSEDIEVTFLPANSGQ